MKSIERTIHQAVDQMGVAVTIIDEKILDRKPEYIGQDLRTHHKKAASNEKFNAMMLAFEQGRAEPFRYEAIPYEKVILVTLSPLHINGQFIGCDQSVMLKDEIPPEK
jgi:hypothetical protein